MNKYLKARHRVDVQVFIMTAVIVIISCGLIFAASYHLTYNGMIEGLAKRANSIHDYAEQELGMESFMKLRSRDDEKSRVYKEAKSDLEKARMAAGVRYLYTAGQNSEGVYVYLVDGLAVENSDFRHVGDPLEEECIPDIKRAMEGEVVLPRKINETSWGDVFIAYFPMHYGDEVIGVLGIEFDATTEYETYRSMSIAAPIIICLFCIIAAIIAVVLFRRISNPDYKDMANTDLLTGLKNRNAFEVDLYNWDKLKEKESLSIISIDLDYLKRVNDTLGHSAGDDYIQEAGRIIMKALDGKGVLYRIGGDEFAVILNNVQQNAVEELVWDITRRRESEVWKEGQRISFSVGCACYDSETDMSLEDTFKRADEIMYINKRKLHKEKGNSVEESNE